MILKVVSYNLFHDYPTFRQLERRLELVESALAEEAPDVTVLQEVSVSARFGSLAARLVAGLRARGLALELFYAPANGSVAEGGDFEEGSAILSRWPIVDGQVRRLAPEFVVRREYQGLSFVEKRIAIRATLALAGGERLDVFGTHVTDFDGGTEPSARRRQLESLVRFVVERSPSSFPAIVAGDFNVRPESVDIGFLQASGFRDACGGSDALLTNDARDRELESPSDSADQRIDYVFVTDGRDRRLEVRSARLFLGAAAEIEPGRWLWASDHNGILAELVLVENEETRIDER